MAPVGQGIADQAVEIWAKRSRYVREPSPVGFKDVPILTSRDGILETPANLMVGSTYRVFIRERGMQPVISDRVKIPDSTAAVCLPSMQTLRTLTGRVVDRQCKPVANVKVVQSGDGPEHTAVRTDADCRFALGGFPRAPVFLFARGEGFRFHGNLIKTSAHVITVELTRTGEPLSRVMNKLPDAIPIEESRALVQRLIDRWWQAAVA